MPLENLRGALHGAGTGGSFAPVSFALSNDECIGTQDAREVMLQAGIQPPLVFIHAELLLGFLIRSLGICRDGMLIAGAAEDHTIRMWDVATGRPLAQMPAMSEEVQLLRFSSDGNLLMAVSGNHQLFLWRVGPEARPAATIQEQLRCRLSNVLDGSVVTTRVPACHERADSLFN
jgi:WD40 repeat protein